MSNQPDHRTQQEDVATLATLPDARAVYFALRHIDGSDNAPLFYNGLKAIPGVLRVDVFHIQGVAFVIYNRNQVSSAELCRAVEQIGIDTRQFFSAEVIGESSAREALQAE